MHHWYENEISKQTCNMLNVVIKTTCSAHKITKCKYSALMHIANLN